MSLGFSASLLIFAITRELFSLVGDHRLALLLSQLVGSQSVRELLTMQLVDWQQLQANCFIQDERLRIFALLAGKPVLSSFLINLHTFSHKSKTA